MSYKILSLKWRPLAFDQIVGQNHITQTLLNAISINRLAQAFLFSGPRGVGKTTTARVLASTINDITDYSKCLDIIELDGASNRGIDEIREIRESVKFPPTSVKYKIYIIDEAHMLTDQAFNALLKTLEEPPPNVIFILATTDPQKMPQTILSRTQRYDFMRISVDAIINRLIFILNEEKIKFNENAIRLISQKADGSMRDALSILDQVIAFSDSSVTVENVRFATGIIDDSDIYDLILYVIKNDIDSAINKFNSIISSGISSKVFIDNLCSFLNNCMLLKINKSNSNIFISDELKDKIDKDFSLQYIDFLKMLNMTLNLSNKIKTIDNPRVSLEVLITKFIIMNSSHDEQKKSKISSLGTPTLDKNSNSNFIKKGDSGVENDTPDENIPKVESANDDSIKKASKEIDNDEDMNSIKLQWDEIISALDLKNSKLSSFLEETTLEAVKANKLILRLDNGNTFVKKVLETDKQIIIDTIREINSKVIDFEIILTKINQENNKSYISTTEDEKDHPLLDDTIKIFNGKIIS